MNPLLLSYISLGVAIVLEVIGTSFLQQSAQFTRAVPTIFMALCYLGSFYFLSISLKIIPVGIAYAIWSGLGIILISTVGYIAFRQSLDIAAVVGIGFIVVGVFIINVFSGSLEPI